MLIATIRRDRATNDPMLYFPDGCAWLPGFEVSVSRTFIYTRTRPAEPTDADCVELVRAYGQPLRIVRRLPKE